ncbi:hypothetical protein ACFLYK_02850 [Candidatus Cloacimonadota bacterium]
MKKGTSFKTLEWITRIWSILSIVFIVVFFIGSFISNKDIAGDGPPSVMIFIFFPIGLLIGLIIAWKYKRIGGTIAVLSMILFHLTVEPELVLFIDLLAFPGLLFFILGIIEKREL